MECEGQYFLQILSCVESQSAELEGGEVEYLVEKAVRHSMCVVCVSSTESCVSRRRILHSCIQVSDIPGSLREETIPNQK